MINYIKKNKFDVLTDLHYVRIRKRMKTPYENNWQSKTLIAKDIDLEVNNVGLLLGETNSNLLAIDFDGSDAIDFFNNNVYSTEKLFNDNYIAFTSKKDDDDRFQMLFKVPFIDNFELKTKVTGPKSHLEFRWNGCQSVLPPSIHPYTNKEYIWINKPTKDNIEKIIPFEILIYWFSLVNFNNVNNNVNNNVVLTNTDNYNYGVNKQEIIEALYKFKGNPPSYPVWRDITWATIRSLGKVEAMKYLKYVLPEQKPNEYKELFDSYKPNTKLTKNTIFMYSNKL